MLVPYNASDSDNRCVQYVMRIVIYDIINLLDIKDLVSLCAINTVFKSQIKNTPYNKKVTLKNDLRYITYANNYYNFRNLTLTNMDLIGYRHDCFIYGNKLVINNCKNVYTICQYIEKCKQLVIKNCSSITDKELQHFINCENVCLNNCDKITDNGLQYLSKCLTLKLRHTQITNIGLKYISQCEYLDIVSCDVTIQGLEYLEKCKKLIISYYSITQEDLKRIREKIESVICVNCNCVYSVNINGNICIFNLRHNMLRIMNGMASLSYET